MYPIDKLIADFDETVSEVDTISLLVHAAIESRTIPFQEGAQVSLLADWQETVEWYSTQYARIVDEWLSSGKPKEIRNRNHSQSASDLADLTDFLKALEALEKTSIRRVTGRKFLAGLTKDRLREMGRNVQKKRGALQVLEAMRTNGVKIEILSANWSKTLIEGAMEGACNQIVTNHLEFDAAGCSTGQIHLRVVSAHDKLRHFLTRKCVLSPAVPSPKGEGGKKRLETQPGQTLYIGDSISDFLAILEADIGMLIGENRTAIQTIERFGLPTRIIADQDRFDPIRHTRGTIFRVDSWERLDCFLSTRPSISPL